MTTVVLALLLLLGLGVAVFVTTPDAPKSAVPPLFLDFARGDVKAVEIHGAGGDVRLERDPADRDRWRVLLGKVPVRASAEKVEDLLNDLSRLAPKNYWKKAEVSPEERKAFGLDAAPVKVSVALEGRTLRASFGGRTL